MTDHALEARLSNSLTVDDIQESLRWYRDVLGFEVVQTMEHEGELRAVMLRAGDAGLLINQDDGAKGWDRKKGEGFSLHFTTSQDVDRIAAGIRKRGGELVSEPEDKPWGARVFELRDPTGYKLFVTTPMASS
jgi:uncharacterized glyoxalase superfamily protein PhnB